MLEIIDGGCQGFDSLWEGFASEQRAGPFYTLAYMRFMKAAAAKRVLEDASFLVLEDGRAVAIAPLVVEEGPKGRQLSCRDQHLRSQLTAEGMTQRGRRKIASLVEERTRSLVQKHKVVMQKSIVDPLAFVHRPEDIHNLLLEEEGFLDDSLGTALLPLHKGLPELWKDLRKSYRGLIHQAQGEMRALCLERESCRPEHLAEFRRLYRLAAGRELYDDALWESAAGLVAEGSAMLTLVMLKDAAVGGGLFFHHKGKAYYAMGANDPELEGERAIGHLCLWATAESYCRSGVEWLETGWQHGSAQLLEKPTGKERQISFFKRGFGGIVRPVFRGIRFFDNGLLREFVEERVKSFFQGGVQAPRPASDHVGEPLARLLEPREAQPGHGPACGQ